MQFHGSFGSALAISASDAGGGPGSSRQRGRTDTTPAAAPTAPTPPPPLLPLACLPGRAAREAVQSRDQEAAATPNREQFLYVGMDVLADSHEAGDVCCVGAVWLVDVGARPAGENGCGHVGVRDARDGDGDDVGGNDVGGDDGVDGVAVSCPGSDLAQFGCQPVAHRIGRQLVVRWTGQCKLAVCWIGAFRCR